MGKKIDAGQAVKEFCNAWFAMGEPDRAAEFLDSDVCFVGAGDREYARGKQEVLEKKQITLLIRRSLSYMNSL